MLRLVAALTVAAPAFAQMPQFEVASVKPAKPADWSRLDAGGPGTHIDAARFDANALPLSALIAFAWEIELHRISCPDWMKTTAFDISATLPSGATKAQIPGMLRGLLTDRFKLKFHNETRPFAVYALIVGKDGPKLRPAAAGAASDPQAMKMAIDANVVEHMELSSISMPDLARILSGAGRPVIDKTGLAGVWHASIDVSQVPMASGTQGPDSAPDPGDSSTLFKSLEKLGLKLQPEKASLDVLVIDRAEKTPAEN